MVKRITLEFLVILTILYVVSGFGITEFRIVETLTFGLLTKNLAFKLHNSLFVPSLIVLTLHVLINVLSKRKP